MQANNLNQLGDKPFRLGFFTVAENNSLTLWPIGQAAPLQIALPASEAKQLGQYCGSSSGSAPISGIAPGGVPSSISTPRKRNARNRTGAGSPSSVRRRGRAAKQTEQTMTAGG